MIVFYGVEGGWKEEDFFEVAKGRVEGGWYFNFFYKILIFKSGMTTKRFFRLTDETDSLKIPQDPKTVAH